MTYHKTKKTISSHTLNIFCHLYFLASMTSFFRKDLYIVNIQTMGQSESGTATNPQTTFNEWLKVQAAKSKTSVIFKETHDILKFLKQKNESLGVHDIPQKIEKRIKRNNFQLMNYLMLNLFDVLCVPSTETTEVSFSHFWIFHINWQHFYSIRAF